MPSETLLFDPFETLYKHSSRHYCTVPWKFCRPQNPGATSTRPIPFKAPSVSLASPRPHTFKLALVHLFDFPNPPDRKSSISRKKTSFLFFSSFAFLLNVHLHLRYSTARPPHFPSRPSPRSHSRLHTRNIVSRFLCDFKTIYAALPPQCSPRHLHLRSAAISRDTQQSRHQ